MRRRWAGAGVVWVLGLGGCPPEVERLRLRVGLRVPAVAGVTWTSGTWQGRAIRLRPCPSDTDTLGWPSLPAEADRVPADPDPAPWTIGLEDPVSILPPSGYARGFAAPWCAVDLVGKGPLVLEGEGPQGTVSVAIDLPDFEGVGVASAPHGEEPSEDVQPEALLIQVGGAAWATELGGQVQAGPVAIEVGTPAHDALQALIVQEVAAYVDRDGDLEVSAADGPAWLSLEVVVPEG